MSLLLNTVIQGNLSYAQSRQAEDGQRTGGYREQFSSLYNVVQQSDYVFASPLGPFYRHGSHFHLPRFFFFGPNANDVSLRLAFLAGVDHHDFRSSSALLEFVSDLAADPELGHGLTLSFFPLVDVLGLMQLAPGRDLGDFSWNASEHPELRLLESDAQKHFYHGFVRLETGDQDDVVSISLRARGHDSAALELISSEESEPFNVRWETSTREESLAGPLAFSGSLASEPFELVVRIPAHWPTSQYREAAKQVLRRFVLRHRAFISYAQHL